MTDFFNQPMSNFRPAVLLAIGFPLVILLLNESITACERRGIALARTLRSLRNFVVPALALLVFVRFVVELPQDNTAGRLVETVFWLSLLYALLGVVNDLVFGIADSSSWRQRVPKLFRDLVRALLVGIGAMVIYSEVWGQEIQGAITALGVGSVVIGLALQEPLGNIVSGLMLLFERPINVGDWVTADGITGKVIEINWRSVHIATPTRELQIIPNVSLYKSAFSNLSRPSHMRTERIEIGFSYDDPPNRVKEIMLRLLNSTPGVLADPAPSVRTANYADFSIIYRLGFTVASQEDLAAVRDDVMTRLWYVTRREGLTIPYPITMEFGPGENPGPAAPTTAEWLREHARFKPALKEDAGTPPRIMEYAGGETVHEVGSAFHGFGLILQGRARLLSTDAAGQPVVLGELGSGECFGDQLTAGGSQADIGIEAAEDLKVMVFDSKAIGDLLSRSPGLADEIGDAIESRLQAAKAAKFRH